MRKALHTKLNEITAFGSRGYQPYNAPDNTTTPYYVLKMLGDNPAPENKRGSIYGFQVFVYTSPDTFTSLDTYVLSVREKLHMVEITTAASKKFVPVYDKTIDDMYDSERNLFFKRIDFYFAGCRP